MHEFEREFRVGEEVERRSRVDQENSQRVVVLSLAVEAYCTLLERNLGAVCVVICLVCGIDRQEIWNRTNCRSKVWRRFLLIEPCLEGRERIETAGEA